MDRKKELKQLYKEEPKLAGVFQIRNAKNQKLFIKSSVNLKAINRQQFQLKHGSHPNKMLQNEWNEYGSEAFEFEILEIIKKREDEITDVKDALKKLEAKWLAKLQPFGEHGYN